MAEETRVEMVVPSDVDRISMVSIVRELLGYVLYMNHQMPCTLDQLDLQVSTMATAIPPEDKKRSRQMLERMKKLRKFQALLDGFMLLVEETLWRTPGLNRVMLLLGTSVTRPQVVYTLHLEPQAFREERSASALDAASKVNQFSRKMIRELISHDVGDTLSGPSKVFLMVEAPLDAMLGADFLPKREFVCKTRKVKRVSLHLLPSPENSTTVDNPEEKIWFQCRRSFRGLGEPR